MPPGSGWQVDQQPATRMPVAIAPNGTRAGCTPNASGAMALISDSGPTSECGVITPIRVRTSSRLVLKLTETFHLLGGPSIGTLDGHDTVVTLDHWCVACNGFAALATARRGDDTATVLFDVGPTVMCGRTTLTA